MRIAVAYSSELLETEPFILAMANCWAPLIRDMYQTMPYWTGLCSWAERALYMFQTANRLYETEERPDANFGPLVDDLLRHGSVMLGFSDDEARQIEQRKSNFAMVAGVRRQAACTMLKQLEALALCPEFKIAEEAKPVVRQVVRVLTQFLTDQG